MNPNFFIPQFQLFKISNFGFTILEGNVFNKVIVIN